MATLNFTKTGAKYIAEATVSNDYNLHLERVSGGRFLLFQRATDDGEYAPCMIPSCLERSGRVIDWSFGHGVYPMHVLIESETEVTSATLTEAQ